MESACVFLQSKMMGGKMQPTKMQCNLMQKNNNINKNICIVANKYPGLDSQEELPASSHHGLRFLRPQRTWKKVHAGSKLLASRGQPVTLGVGLMNL